MTGRVRSGIRTLPNLPVRTNRVAGLLLFHFYIDTSEEINMGTGKRLFYYLDLPFYGTNLSFTKGCYDTGLFPHT